MLYQEILNESFDASVKWRWIEHKEFEHIATFKINNTIYIVSMFLTDSSRDLWTFEFAAGDDPMSVTHRVTGTGNAWKVFGTIIRIARYFIRRRHPKTIKIESDLTERSRFAVNKRIADAIVKGFPYTISLQKHDIFLNAKDKNT